MIPRASRNELGIVLTYIHLERSGGQVASSASCCTVRALHSTTAVPTVGGQQWSLGCLPAANRIEDAHDARWSLGGSPVVCGVYYVHHGSTLAAEALGERVLGRQVSVKSEVSFCVTI